MLNQAVGALLILLGASTISGCSDPETYQTRDTWVDTYTLPATDNLVIREFNGMAKAQDLTQLSFRVEGRIAKIPVVKGQLVKKGDLLAVLEKHDYQIALNDRTARMDVSLKQANRIQLLVQKELIAQTEYDQLHAQYLVAQAQTKQAELNLQYTELKAPFDGMVSDVFLESFENVHPGKAVLSVQKVERIDVDVQIPDMLIAVSHKHEDKRPLEVSFEAFPEVKFVGYLLEVNTEKDPKTSSYIATISVELSPEYKVLEGMPAKVKVNLSDMSYVRKREYLLPIKAVIMKDGGQITQQEAGVWLLDEQTQTVHYQPVQLGVVVGENIEVVSGLQDGQTVVTTGAARLIEGQKVQRVQG